MQFRIGRLIIAVEETRDMIPAAFSHDAKRFRVIEELDWFRPSFQGVATSTMNRITEIVWDLRLIRSFPRNLIFFLAQGLLKKKYSNVT